MADYREAFVGIDVAKLRNAIAIADSGREGEVRFFGEVDTSDQSMRRIIQRIAGRFDRVHFCYEAGPTGYGLYRLIRSLGHECMVVAPSLIPRKRGDRVKTNRRDALALARLLRAGELTAVWVPDEGVVLPHVTLLPLASSRMLPARPESGVQVSRWQQNICLTNEPLHCLLSPGSYALLQRMKLPHAIVAVTFATEVGDVQRFESPRQLMGYLGLVPGERSTGETVRRGGITKAGNGRVRHMLVESAWTYRHPRRVGAKKLYRLEQASPKVREIAWKAQTRLTTRSRMLSGRGKKTTVVCTAIARELAGFMWAVAREAQAIRP